MKRLSAILLLLLLRVGQVLAADDWFVDADVSSSGDGQEWATAWKSVTNIVWASISPGDTVYISGGTTSKTYSGRLKPTKAGTEALPITIRPGQASPHNGVVIFSEVFQIAGGISYSNIVLDGSRSASFDTNGINPMTPWGITNNIGFVFHSLTDYGISIQPGDGIKIRWTEIKTGDPDHMDLTGIQWDLKEYPDGYRHRRNCEIGYCFIHECSADGIYDASSYNGDGLGRVMLHHSIIVSNADDCFEGTAGWDICYNLIGDDNPDMVSGHPDGIQPVGQNNRIYNNILITTENSAIYCEPLGNYSEWGQNFFCYGNVTFRRDTNDNPGDLLNIHPRVIESNDVPYVMVWTNVVMANNTVAYSAGDAAGIKYGGFSVPNPTPNPGQTTNSTFQCLSNAFLLNNVGWRLNVGGTGNSGIGGMEPVETHYNTLDSAGGLGTTKMSHETDLIHYGALYGDDLEVFNTPELFNAGTGSASNISATVSFVSTNLPTPDFQLQASDVGAKDIGIHPSNYIPAFVLAMMPDYDKDMLGNTRGADGKWDRGAFEYTAESNAPSISVSPSTQTAHLDSNVLFSVTASGTSPLAYQWYYNSNIITWASSNGTSLTLTNIRDTNEGFYHVVVTNLYGKATSTVATLTVTNNGLVLWLTFQPSDGWETNHVIYDQSGMGNHAYYCESTNRETWPSPVAGPTNGTYGSQFIVNYTNVKQYGTYAAITSLTTNQATCGLSVLTQASWLTWAYIDEEHIGYYRDNVFMAVGYDASNWFFGKYYSESPSFYRVITNAWADAHETYVNFPFVTNSAWHHYAVVWNGSTFASYYDGALFTNSLDYTNNNTAYFTNEYSGLMISTNRSSGIGNSWMGIGVNTHMGTWNPDDGDGYPNNGQLWGRLSDMRIYNRPLSAEEVALIVGTDYEPPAPSTNAVQKAVFRGKSAIRGKANLR